MLNNNSFIKIKPKFYNSTKQNSNHHSDDELNNNNLNNLVNNDTNRIYYFGVKSSCTSKVQKYLDEKANFWETSNSNQYIALKVNKNQQDVFLAHPMNGIWIKKTSITNINNITVNYYTCRILSNDNSNDSINNNYYIYEEFNCNRHELISTILKYYTNNGNMNFSNININNVQEVEIAKYNETKLEYLFEYFYCYLCISNINGKFYHYLKIKIIDRLNTRIEDCLYNISFKIHKCLIKNGRSSIIEYLKENDRDLYNQLNFIINKNENLEECYDEKQYVINYP